MLQVLKAFSAASIAESISACVAMGASAISLLSAGFVTENAVRYANREMKKNEVPSLFGLLKLLKDEETRKGLAFVLHLTKGIGKQV